MLSCPELLSPAGSLEALKYAVMYGADAVYCALPRIPKRGSGSEGRNHPCTM